MKRIILVFVPIFILLFSSIAVSSPILPNQKSMLFEGELRYWNEYTSYSFIQSISGIINFNLVYQNEIQGGGDLDWVRWAFTMVTSDNKLAASGFFDNEEATGLQNQVYLDWGGSNWDIWGTIDESYTSIIWNNFFSASIDDLQDDLQENDWNLQTNANFLPTNISFYSGGDIVSGDRMSVSISIMPVPEPSTIYLVCIGFLLIGTIKSHLVQRISGIIFR